MLDHVGLTVGHYETSKAFYISALAPLEYKVVMEGESWAGLGANGKPDFWIYPGKQPTQHLHLAFRSPNRAMVDAFYKAALQAGGKDNGPPGMREIYHPNYYGAFVLDPDGNNIEAVCHDPT